MNIAMIGHKRIPGREGGIEVVVEELSSRLVQNGHNVIAYNRRKKGVELPSNYKGVNLVDVFTIEKKATNALIYSFIASIRVIFSKSKIVHYHGIGPSLFLIFPRIFGKKIIVTVHGLNYKTPKWKGLGAKILKLGELVTAKFADRIIVLSKEQQKYFLEKYSRKTEYIPNGTVINNIEPVDLIKDKYGLNKDNYILFVSRVVPGKGLEYLIDAYKNISSDLNLIVAGDSAFVPEFRDKVISQAADDNRIKFIGFVQGKILQELYSNARLFVFPSEAEGMPMCLLEALSYECPCLVSDIPENLEVGKTKVISFKSCDVKDLENKLNQILSKPKEISSTREYIKENYSWDSVVQKTTHCYEEVCK